MKRSTIRVKKPLMVGYVSEASNILIQRLMVQSNSSDDWSFDPFTLFTFDSSLKACRVSYVCRCTLGFSFARRSKLTCLLFCVGVSTKESNRQRHTDTRRWH